MKKAYRYLLALLGITSCGSCMVMYGCPNADFVIDGNVVNSKEEPISGIKVSIVPPKYRADNLSDTTDVAGHFNITSSDTSVPDSLYVTDIDGEANGRYKDKAVVLHMQQTKKGDGDWYEGTYEDRNIKVTLEEEK